MFKVTAITAFVAIVLISECLCSVPNSRGLEKLKEDSKRFGTLQRGANNATALEGGIPAFEDMSTELNEIAGSTGAPSPPENEEKDIEAQESQYKYDFAASKLVAQEQKKNAWQSNEGYHKKMVQDTKRNQAAGRKDEAKGKSKKVEPETTTVATPEPDLVPRGGSGASMNAKAIPLNIYYAYSAVLCVPFFLDFVLDLIRDTFNAPHYRQVD